jgi:hypothetical protein
MVIRYVDRSERHIWTSLPGYIDCDWDDFCDELQEQYVSLATENKFSKQKLVRFADRYAWKCMADEMDVINYHWKFNNLTKILIDSECITKRDRNAVFWHGFHPDDQQVLHERLIAKHPDNPRGQAFDHKDVLKTAQAIFSGDDDFLLQEPTPRRSDYGHAHERQTEHSSRDQ